MLVKYVSLSFRKCRSPLQKHWLTFKSLHCFAQQFLQFSEKDLAVANCCSSCLYPHCPHRNKNFGSTHQTDTLKIHNKKQTKLSM